MQPSDAYFNEILGHIIANSLFTRRQVSIIYNHAKTGKRLPNMTSGAYYRQVKQAKDKVIGLIYSLVLIRSLGILDENAFVTIDRLAEQIGVILAIENSDAIKKDKVDGVISVMDQMIKRMCRV